MNTYKETLTKFLDECLEKWYNKLDHFKTDKWENYKWLKDMISTAHGLYFLMNGKVSKDDNFEYKKEGDKK